MHDSWKPPGYTSVSPYLVTQNAEAVIAFLEASFAGSLIQRLDRPNGSVMHAEVQIDDSVVMLGEPEGDARAVPSHVHLYVPEVDTVYAAALGNGGESVQVPAQHGDPDRRGGVRDPGGNTWWISSRIGGGH